jgi:hypothetical protein
MDARTVGDSCDFIGSSEATKKGRWQSTTSPDQENDSRSSLPNGGGEITGLRQNNF